MKRTLPVAIAAAVFFSITGSPAAARPVLPFVDDDYARAVADAKTRGVPLFVEIWAPW